MLTPNLFVERNPRFPGQVAVGAQFASSFDNNNDRDFEHQSNKIPAKLEADGKDFHFVFILDRSGSMQGTNIKVARKALQLFVQSLPEGCKFSIISFGSSWELHKSFGSVYNENGAFSYTNEVLKEAIAAMAISGQILAALNLINPSGLQENFLVEWIKAKSRGFLF